MSKSFLILATGVTSNDAAIKRFAGEKAYMCYRLPYTPPYKDFEGIKQFQLEAKYRPFEDGTEAFKYAGVDVSEWVGHEKEEYLELFMKFIHDYTGFFHFKFIFVSSCTEQSHIKGIFQLANRYLQDGEVLLDKTFADEKALSMFIAKKYRLTSAVTTQLSKCFVCSGMSGYAELELVVKDIIARVGQKEEIELEDIRRIANEKSSKLYSLYRDERNMLEEEIQEK